jgi:hypothetical protein
MIDWLSKDFHESFSLFERLGDTRVNMQGHDFERRD